MNSRLLVVMLVVGSIFSGMPAGAEPAADNLDRQFLGVEERVPGFGGAYVEGDATAGEKKVLHIWLIEATDESLQKARQALRDIIGLSYSADSAVPHRADFAFSALWRWKESATELIGRHGVDLVDIDERRNRLLVGVDRRSGDTEAATNELIRRGVPRQAIVVSQVDGFKPLPAGDKGIRGVIVTGATVVLALAVTVFLRRRRTR